MAVEDQRAAGSTFFRQANEAVHGMIRILRAKPSAQDQQQPVELRRAAFEVEALTSDCDSRELVGGTVFPQVEIDYSVCHATSCLRNLATSSGSSSCKCVRVSASPRRAPRLLRTLPRFY